MPQAISKGRFRRFGPKDLLTGAYFVRQGSRRWLSPPPTAHPVSFVAGVLALVVTWVLPLERGWAYEVCLDIPLSDALVDASPEGMLDFGEDRGRDEGSNPFPLQRWLYRVRDHDQPDKILAGWAPLSSNGCTEDFERDVLLGE